MSQAGSSPEPTQEPIKEPIKDLASKVGDVAPPVQSEVPPTPEFVPNYKFKANQKEHEIPELLRGAIKDGESEKFVKQLLERSYGFDPVKERYQQTKQEFSQVKGEYDNILRTADYARQAYQRGDLDTVFDTFQISPEKVLQWAIEKVQLSQMPPDQRQVHEARTEAERKAWELERQHKSQYDQQLDVQSQYIGQMLDLVLERPDYSAVAQAYDSRKSKPGAFRELVIRVGESETALSGKVLTPMEAASKALELLGEQLQKPTNPIQQQTAPVPEQPQPKKITLPNVAGSKAASPAKGKIKSLDDLYKARDKIMNT